MVIVEVIVYPVRAVGIGFDAGVLLVRNFMGCNSEAIEGACVELKQPGHTR